MFKRFLGVIIGVMVCLNLLWLPPIQGAGSNDNIRVKLASLGSIKSINIGVDGFYGIPQINKNNLLTKGNYTVRVESGKLVLDDKTGSKTVSTVLGNNITFKRYQGTGTNQLSIGNYKYLGDMEVYLTGSNIELVNHIHLETYLYGVVPYEVSNDWQIETQKAQAVAARTYAVGHRSASSNYDVVDTTNDQVYRGYNPNYKNSIKAVNETFAVVLKYGNGYASTFYSASNGGMIESTKNLWGSNLPYCQVKEDPYDIKNEGNPFRSWTVTYKAKPVDSGLKSRLEFTKALKDKGLEEKDIENLEIKEFKINYNDSQRADNGQIVFSMNKKEDKKDPPKGEEPDANDPPEEILVSIALSKSTMRTVLDIRSLLFKVEYKNGNFVFNGSGWGHGIGMSQYGAHQMAKDGKKYAEILGFYYPGTSLSTLSIDVDRGGDLRPDPVPDPKPDPKPGNEGKQQFAKVSVSPSLNVRKGPGTNYNIIGSLYNGDKVEILDRSGAWYKIKKGTLEGYAHGDYIILDDTGQTTPKPPKDPDPKPGVTDPAPPPSKDKRYGIVTASALNVRSGPSTKNHIVGMVAKGAKLTVLDSKSEWYKISFNGKDAYVHSDYVKLESQGSNTTAPSNPSGTTLIGKATVTASVLNVRSGASTSYKIIGSLSKGKSVELLEKSGAWYKIKYASGTGFVHGDYLKLNSSGTSQGGKELSGLVTASALNIRSGPGTNYTRKGLLYRGEKVSILGESGAWYEIKSGSISGYVSKDYIKL